MESAESLLRFAIAYRADDETGRLCKQLRRIDRELREIAWERLLCDDPTREAKHERLLMIRMVAARRKLDARGVNVKARMVERVAHA